MKTIYKKYLTNSALIWAGCLVLFIFAYMLFLKPQARTKRQLDKELAEEKRIYVGTSMAAREETRLKMTKELEELRSRVGEFVTDSEGSANLIFDISQIANEKGVSSFSIKTRNKSRTFDIPNCNYIGEERIDVSFIAGYNQFVGFLNALERHRPVVFVDTFSITRSRDSGLRHDVSMGLSVFVQKQADI